MKIRQAIYKKGRFIPLYLFMVLALLLSACDFDPGAGTEVGEVEPTEAAEGEMVDEEITDEETVGEETVGEEIADDVVVDEVAVDEETAALEVNTFGIAGTEGNLLRGYTLLDLDFENRDNAVSGEIEDLLIDLSSGRVLFALIEYGGFLDIGDTHLPVPLSAFMHGEEGELVLNFDEQELESFPGLDEDWPDITNAGWDDEATTFWRNIDIDPGFDFDETNSNTVMRLSDMTGFTLVDLGEGVGTIHDVLIDLNAGHIKYILFGFGTTAADDDSFIVPYSAMDVQGTVDEGFFDNNEIAFNSNISAEDLITAPRFDPFLYPEADMIESGFSEEVDSYWTERGFEVE